MKKALIIILLVFVSFLHGLSGAKNPVMEKPYNTVVDSGVHVKKVIAINPTANFRVSETISLDFKKIQDSIPDINRDNAVVYDFKTDCLLVTQIIEDDGGIELFFQTSFAPGEKKSFWIMKQPATLSKPESKLTTYCRFVPEREDDFAWENDRVAFRMYGPSLWDDSVNSGVDCWLKCVDYPIIDKWYGNMDQKTYHKDWGEGYDPYHVGKSAGCGGLRIIEDNKYIHSNVYDSWEVIANGPIRSIFELKYDKSWKDSGKQLVETKRISIDLGQQLCHFKSTFSGPDVANIKKFAIGITTHDQKAKSVADDCRDIAYCWETIDSQGLGTGVIADTPSADSSFIVKKEEKDESHISLIVNSNGIASVSYYAGFGWAKAGKITSIEDWKSYLEGFKERLDSPIQIEFEN